MLKIVMLNFSRQYKLLSILLMYQCVVCLLVIHLPVEYFVLLGQHLAKSRIYQCLVWHISRVF